MMSIEYKSRLLLGLVIGLISIAPIFADEEETRLLLHPGSALSVLASNPNIVTLAPQLEGQELSFDHPQILIHKNTNQAEFISAIWQDSLGQVSHQRSVLVVKPDYVVVVDYVHQNGTHALTRNMALSSTEASFTGACAQFTLSDGTSLYVQALDPAKPTIIPSSFGKCVLFSSQITLPAPISTVLFHEGKSSPCIEFIKPVNPMIVKCKVTFPGGRIDDVALAWESRRLHLGKNEFEGWAACLRQDSAGTSRIEIN